MAVAKKVNEAGAIWPPFRPPTGSRQSSYRQKRGSRGLTGTGRYVFTVDNDDPFAFARCARSGEVVRERRA